MKPKRPTQRDPQKVAFSVALPRVLVADIERIAEVDHRTRNGQIVHFLAEAVARYEAAKQTPAPLYVMPEPDLERDIAAEPPPAPYGAPVNPPIDPAGDALRVRAAQPTPPPIAPPPRPPAPPKEME